MAPRFIILPASLSHAFDMFCYRQDFRQYRGHACPVRNCSFLTDDNSLVTSGGRDCALLLWGFEARADGEGAGTDEFSSKDRELLLTDVEVETVMIADNERLQHPDLKDLSRQGTNPIVALSR